MKIGFPKKKVNRTNNWAKLLLIKIKIKRKDFNYLKRKQLSKNFKPQRIGDT